MEEITLKDHVLVVIKNKKNHLSDLEYKEKALSGANNLAHFELSIVRAEIYLLKDFISDLEFILTL